MNGRGGCAAVNSQGSHASGGGSVRAQTEVQWL